jgi:hypothetical protein
MQVIKHKLDDILVISLVFEDQDDIESIRAYAGGTNAATVIKNSNTPTAPIKSAAYMGDELRKILNPLSNLFDEKKRL